MTNLFRTTNAKFCHKWVHFVQESPIRPTKIILVCFYASYVLNFWRCIPRNNANISQVNIALFFNSCYFHNVDFFHCDMLPLCPRNLETQRKLGGDAKKNSGALRQSLCPQLQNRVGAYMSILITIILFKINFTYYIMFLVMNENGGDQLDGFRNCTIMTCFVYTNILYTARQQRRWR